MREKLIEEKNIIVQEGQRGIKSCHFPLHKIKAFIHPWHVQVMFFQGKKKHFLQDWAKHVLPSSPPHKNNKISVASVYFVDKGKLLFGPCFPQSPLGSLYCFVSHIENDDRKRHGRYAVRQVRSNQDCTFEVDVRIFTGKR
jgi:hypothetical protein